MDNTLVKLSDSERLLRSWSHPSVRKRSRWAAPIKMHRGARLAAVFRGTYDDIVEAKARRRHRKARLMNTTGPIPIEELDNVESLPSRSNSTVSWTTAHSQQDLQSQHSESITRTPTSPTSASKPERREEELSLKDCTICTESLPRSRFPRRSPTTSCTHSPDTCRRCLRKWISYSFLTRVWDNIDCPECDQRLQHTDVKASADPKLAAKYEELAAKAAMEAIPGFRWCIAKRCESGQVHFGEKMPRFVCVECKAEQCAIHGVPWHKKETCAEYEYRTKGKKRESQDKKTQKWLEKKTKQCPSCGWNIQKSGGCDHMMCSKCELEFCFECLGKAIWDEEDINVNMGHRYGCSNAIIVERL